MYTILCTSARGAPVHLKEEISSMQDSLQIFNASSGNPSARIILPDETVRHLHSTVKPEAEADYFTDISLWGDILIFTGIGLGYHLGDTIRKIPPSATLIIIDYYEELLNHCLKNVFNTVPNEIVTISAIDVETKKEEIKKRITCIQTPQIQTIKHPASFAVHNDFYGDILAQIIPSASVQNNRERSYQKCLLLSGNFFLQKECERALQQVTKKDPAVFKYEKVLSDSEYESHLQRIIQREKPDFILSVNMKGFDGSGILNATAQRFGIPVVVWFVDDPHPILLQHCEYINDSMIALCWEKTFLPYLEKKGFSRVAYLPLATDPNLFSGSGSSPAAPRVPVGFVGSSMGDNFLTDIKRKFLWSDSLIPLVEAISDNLLKNPALSVYSTIQQQLQDAGMTLPFSDDRNITWLCSLIIHTASMKKRKRIIGSLIPLTIETFGDPEGWKQLLGDSLKTNPDLDYTTQLGNCYRDIAINLNITSCQMPSAVNQRVFDIPMAGSFVISDNQKDLEELFEIDKEAIAFNSPEELTDLITCYSNTETARHNIIKKAQIRIKKEHTYFHRIEALFSIIKNDIT